MRTRSAVLAATAAAVVASAATAVATIPSSTGTINGCYAAGSPPPHELTIVDNPDDCTETLLPFAQTGPTGAPGPSGPAGPQGLPGPPLKIKVTCRLTGEKKTKIKCTTTSKPAQTRATVRMPSGR